MGFKEELKRTIRNRFISGILVIVPLFVAVAVLKFVIESVDSFMRPYLVKLLGQQYGFPYMGLVVTVGLVILTGIFTTNVFGQRLLAMWERILLKIPFFNIVYSASKQLVEGLAVPEKRTLEKVVVVEYPRKGIYALGFLANRIRIRSAEGERDLLSIFIPSTPTPFTGVAVLFPKEEVNILDMTVEEGIKFFVSGSVSAPREIPVAGISYLGQAARARRLARAAQKG